MSEQRHIDQLMVPPRVVLTRRERVLQIIGYVCSVIAVVALTVSVYATKQAWAVATCVNNVLGTRAAPQALDNQAHVDFARSVLGLFDVKPDATAAERAAAAVTFHEAVQSYVNTLVDDQKLRDETPLGRC